MCRLVGSAGNLFNEYLSLLFIKFSKLNLQIVFNALKSNPNVLSLISLWVQRFKKKQFWRERQHDLISMHVQECVFELQKMFVFLTITMFINGHQLFH